ncbi:hypothetical protein THII_2682 [Thioploca ingrica]|uniref:Hint domain-containing protein n=1 Tax=Thioploca ingrica TaxID=40754 RepID=A0A090AI21_9GAMM|nr:hypothetical protein THII_2682 [Thioploca ingrica]
MSSSTSQPTFVEVGTTVEEYLSRQDWRVQANANQGYSLGGLILNVSGKVIANYWLNHVYTPEIGAAHREGDFHIHDLDMLCGYCAGWSLRLLLAEGFNGVENRVEAKPPKHLSSAIGQMVNFLGTLQNEWAGAQAFSSFDTYLAPLVRKDNLSYSQVKQCVQELIYNLNVPSRWGGQTVFSNLTFDWVCPEDLREQIPIIAGEELPFCYGDLQAEMDMLNRAFIEVMTEGDAKGRVFTFPVPTYNITPDFPWNNPNTDLLFEMTAKFGLPYFQGFINSDLQPNMVRSMCLFPEENIFFKENKQIAKTTIHQLFTDYKTNQLDNEWWQSKPNLSVLSLNPQSGKLEWVKVTHFLQITDNKLVSILSKDGKLMRLSSQHLVAILTKKGIETKKAEKVEIGDFILVVKDASAALNQTEPTEIDKLDLSNDRIEWLRNSDFAVVPVTSVNVELLGYQQEFYDIELEKNHYFVHSDGNISHNCCRLQLDLRELLKRGNGLFGSSEQTGSLGVVTINCARLGYVYQGDEQSLLSALDRLLELAKNSLEIKRKAVQQWMDSGLYPYTKRYLGTLRNHFSTIGVNGINEMIRNFTQDAHDITSDWGHQLALRLLDYIRDKMVVFQEETGHLYNLEATPAEGTTYRFAREDKKRYPDILQAGTSAQPYYTNSSQLPVGFTDDPFKALEYQDELQSKYTGGTIMHLYMNERISSAKACKTLVRKVLERFRLPYLTITPTFSICPIHGYLSGEHPFCPRCDEELLIKKTKQETKYD